MFKDELAGFTFLWGAGRAANGGAKAASRPVVAMLQRRAAASLPQASEMSSSIHARTRLRSMGWALQASKLRPCVSLWRSCSAIGAKTRSGVADAPWRIVER